jgi:hypothetical protein
MERAFDALLLKLEKQRLGKAKRPLGSPPRSNARPGDVPRAVRRAVFERDGERCTFVDENGRRCESRTWLELDHRFPRALGGADDASNLSVRCRAHNQLSAECMFGRKHIERRVAARRSRIAATRESRPSQDLALAARSADAALSAAARHERENANPRRRESTRRDQGYANHARQRENADPRRREGTRRDEGHENANHTRQRENADPRRRESTRRDQGYGAKAPGAMRTAKTPITHASGRTRTRARAARARANWSPFGPSAAWGSKRATFVGPSGSSDSATKGFPPARSRLYCARRSPRLRAEASAKKALDALARSGFR